MSDSIPRPSNDAEFEAKMTGGWCVAYPPNDYKGSIADWTVAMEERGYPGEYEKLLAIMIPDRVWWEVLIECEGTSESGES